MPIELNCPECGKSYKLQDALAGKKVRCKACSAVMVVPQTEGLDDFADLVDVDDVEDYDSPPPKARRRSTVSRRSDDEDESPRKKKGKKKSGKSAWSSPWVWIGGIGAGFLVCMVICCGALPGMLGNVMQKEMMKQAGIDPAKQVAFGDPTSLFPVGQIPLPTFPELGPAKVLEPSGVKVHFVQMPKQHGAAPGHGMNFRVYVPPGDHAPQSIPCVLVAPAGTNLLIGNDMDNDDYHKETLPYAEAGMAVIFYSLDGPCDMENSKDAELGVAYLKFRAAMAGVVNGRNALEFALSKLPQVDPKRIYSAGHSSAGNVSLLLAAHEPRLAASIGFAACSDVEARLGPMNNAATRILLPDLTSFLKQSSPKTHSAKINCPVFLFHAQDDSNVPVGDSQTLAQLLQAAGKKVELKLVPTGDHYQPMIDEGVPSAVAWLKGLNGPAADRGAVSGSP